MTDAEREAKKALRVLATEAARRAEALARDSTKDPVTSTRRFQDALAALETLRCFVGLRGNGLRDGDA